MARYSAAPINPDRISVQTESVLADEFRDFCRDRRLTQREVLEQILRWYMDAVEALEAEQTIARGLPTQRPGA